MNDSLLSEVSEYIRAQYNTEAERPWMRAPDYIVFRHRDNKRMFGVAVTVPFSRLGKHDETPVDIITLKVGDPLLRDILLRQEGIYPGLGFGQRDWITVILDGTVPWENVSAFIDRSFWTTASAKTQKIRQPYAAKTNG